VPHASAENRERGAIPLLTRNCNSTYIDRHNLSPNAHPSSRLDKNPLKRFKIRSTLNLTFQCLPVFPFDEQKSPNDRMAKEAL